MSTELGCGDYSLAVDWTRCGERPGERVRLFSPDRHIIALRWGRRLNKWSTAKIEILFGDCCELIEELRTVAQDLVIVRNDTVVWRGPVTSLEYEDEILTIEAADLLWHLQGRLISGDFGPADLSTLVEEMIGSRFFGRNDPGILENAFGEIAGTSGGFSYAEDSYTTVWEAVRDLISAGLDVTVVAGQLLFGKDIPTPSLGSFTDEHFRGAMSVRKRGDLYATKIIAVGTNGVQAIAEIFEIDACLTRERVVVVDSNDPAVIQATADAALELSYPSPLQLVLPSSASFASTAPICIDELVPGATGSVSSAVLCEDAVDEYLLTGIEVKVDDGEEAVRASFQSLGGQGEAVSAL